MRSAHSRYPAQGEGDAETLERHRVLVDRAARALARRTGGAVSADDLWSAGAMGLIEASRRFDATRDVRFESFAERRIRGAMLDEMRRMDHLPRRLRAQVEKVERARLQLGQRLGREPQAEELAAEVGLPLEEVEALGQLALPQASLFEDLVAEAPRADEQAARAETLRDLTAAITGLPERLQLLLSLHYAEGLTYREMAGVLDVSEPRICQLHADAVERLRQALRAQ
jgi:RNA polymerase sigma factor for flagellar operon FliA